METKHTSGPWTIRPVWIGKEIVEFSIEHEKGHLASVHCAVDSELEDDANARLIAAAPEMLEALKVTAKRMREGQPGLALSWVDNAIAKAERKS